MKRGTCLLMFFLCCTAASASAAAQTISDEAMKHFQKGKEIISQAQSPEALRPAEEEFRKVIDAEPAWPDGYYNYALLSEELGRPVRAIKALQKYLDIAGNVPDREEVVHHIDRLRRIREAKRRIGMAGVTLVSLKNGIYVANLISGSRIEKAGFRKGDLIVLVNQREIPGNRLEEFYNRIEKPHENEKIENRLQHYGKSVGIGKPVEITGVRGGKEFRVLCSLDVFRSKMVEIEEDEIDDIAVHSAKPVLITFWAEWCRYCREFFPVLEELADAYAGQIEFVTLDANRNRDAVDLFGVKGIPTSIFFRDGGKRWVRSGLKDRETLEGALTAEGFTPRRASQGGETQGVILQPPQSRQEKQQMTALIGKVLAAKGLVQGSRGVCVKEVSPGSAAEKGGLVAGDSIVSADGEPIADVQGFVAWAGRADEGRHRLGVLRSSEEREIDIDLPARGRPGRVGVLIAPCGSR